MANMIKRAMMYDDEDVKPIQVRIPAHPDSSDGSLPLSLLELPERCINCLSPYHWTRICEYPCGHCGQRWHAIDMCESIPRNHCKCCPFPQRHLAKRCPILCTKECPKTEKDEPGSEYHRNAMMCKARCCMCGLLGHAGRDCHLKTCRCGGHHLTIEHDPERRNCVVDDCPRWFCNKHCQKPECKVELKSLGAETCHSCGAEQRKIFLDRQELRADPDW
ncbi:major facilitator superfamily transporter [Colletotrichum kahawae]|uniref:Major facilitator superfamily transporter n=1 Tax=Colletotrichum kahawae TaxID=34407 RepID=A0AAD9YQG6_COLKA|nr:major facilitator superfamily transporter [Colletotrichum kahawae]